MPAQSNRQRIAKLIESGDFPRYLYKYRPLYSSINPLMLVGDTTSIITKAEMWHPAPTTFNDPFDCQIVLDGRYSDAIIRSMAKLFETPQQQAPGQRKSRREGLKNLRRNTRFVVDRAQRHIRNAMAATGLCSYGRRGDNLLMWAHYGDSHRGICLKFDVLADLDSYLDMMPVTYSSEYPCLRGIDQASIRQVLTVKSDVWAYEQECRVFNRTGPGGRPFQKSALVEITFGAQAAAEPTGGRLCRTARCRFGIQPC